MDGDSPDLGRVHAIATSVDRAFSTLGGKSALRMAARLGHMSADVIAAVTARCDEHPGETLQRSTAEVFAGMVSMQQITGIA